VPLAAEPDVLPLDAEELHAVAVEASAIAAIPAAARRRLARTVFIDFLFSAKERRSH
jgi:hypothetical protein